MTAPDPMTREGERADLPLRATPEMIAAGWRVLRKGRESQPNILRPGAGMVEVWAAMVAVAPALFPREG